MTARPGYPPSDYEKYRRSKLWKTIKARIFERDRGKCFRCGGQADVVHHRSYAPEVMQGLADEFLVCLCDGCHTVVHWDEPGIAGSLEPPARGRLRPWTEAETILNTPDRRTDFPEPIVDLRHRRTLHPVQWERMTAIQKGLWSKREKELRLEKQTTTKKRGYGRPSYQSFASFAEAQAAAYRIIDMNPKLAGRFRSSREALGLALLSQGHDLSIYDSGAVLTLGLGPNAAMKRFAERKTAHGHAPLSKEEQAGLASEAIWDKTR